jgi:hypothetical protein
MKTIAQLIAHRDAITEAYELIRAGVPEHMQAEMARRIANHDADKFQAISNANYAAYAAHDFRSDHHVAYWVINGGSIGDCAFIEHVCDHIAVNINHDQSTLFDFAWFYSQQAFTRDMHFGNSPEVLELIQVAKFKYAAKCSAYSEFLAWVNEKLGTH